MLRYMTAGESHGKALISIIEGLPGGLKIDVNAINRDLKRRMLGYGRGGRMKIETDRVEIISGLRKNRTMGSPLCILIENTDSNIDRMPNINKARPGHADLAGALKYNTKDIRSILERASARETAQRVAVGAVAKTLLAEFGVDILSHVTSLGGIEAKVSGLTFSKIKALSETMDIRCADRKAVELMKKEIDRAKKAGDSLGGICEILVRGVVPGLGSHVHWDRKLDGSLAGALMSIPAVKGVEIGKGFGFSSIRGSNAHDEILYIKGKGFAHKTNNAGGLEGGMTNGEDVVLRVAMKPIATLMRPLNSVDIRSKRKALAEVERADTTAVSACGVVAEAVSAIEIANAMLEKFGSDSMVELKRNFNGYVSQIMKF